MGNHLLAKSLEDTLNKSAHLNDKRKSLYAKLEEYTLEKPEPPHFGQITHHTIELKCGLPINIRKSKILLKFIFEKLDAC